MGMKPLIEVPYAKFTDNGEQCFRDTPDGSRAAAYMVGNLEKMVGGIRCSFIPSFFRATNCTDLSLLFGHFLPFRVLAVWWWNKHKELRSCWKKTVVE